MVRCLANRFFCLEFVENFVELECVTMWIAKRTLKRFVCWTIKVGQSTKTAHKHEGRSGKEHAFMKLGTSHGIYFAMTAVYRTPAFTTRKQSDTEPSMVANKPTALANQATVSLQRSPRSTSTTNKCTVMFSDKEFKYKFVDAFRLRFTSDQMTKTVVSTSLQFVLL
jgi:hypothetical protein